MGRSPIQALILSVQLVRFQATTAMGLILAVIFVVVNLVVDMLYVYLDPRISYLEEK